MAILAMVIAHIAYDSVYQTQHHIVQNNPKEAILSQDCEPQLVHLREELKLLKTKLSKEEEDHNKLKTSCERLESSYKLIEKIEQLYDQRVKDKEEHLSTKDKAIDSLEISIESLKSELRIVKDQMANIKHQLISLEEEQKTADTECTTTLCSGLKLLKSSVDAILGIVN